MWKLPFSRVGTPACSAPTHCVPSFLWVTLRRRGPWLSQFRGEWSRASLRDHPRVGGMSSTFIRSPHHCEGRPQLSIRPGLGRYHLPSRWACAGLHLLSPLPHPMGLRGPASSSCMPWDALAPHPSLRVPYTTHPTSEFTALWDGVSGGHALLCPVGMWLTPETSELTPCVTPAQPGSASLRGGGGGLEKTDERKAGSG